jgi:hypothetical protein
MVGRWSDDGVNFWDTYRSSENHLNFKTQFLALIFGFATRSANTPTLQHSQLLQLLNSCNS